MPDTLTIRRHAALVDRMAQTVGVDLEESTLQGRITPDALCDAVLSCTGCTDPTACAQWLDAHRDGAEATPSMCRNAETFDLLKAGKRV